MRAFIRRLLGVPEAQPDRANELKFVLNELSEMRQLLRMLLADSPRYHAQIAQTTTSFETQWKLLPKGVQLLGNPEFDRQSIALVEQYTGLPSEWFRGKRVLDAGSGNGRWSYTLASLGAQVTAMDQSESGLDEVRRVCGRYPGFQTIRHDLLSPLPEGTTYDLVWTFGVAHHTGDTERALGNVCSAVRPGGAVFAMIYGEPRGEFPGDYAEINTYTELRRELAGMSFEERIAYLRRRFPEDDVNAWFDGVSPKINDLHRFDEVREWLRMWGFTDIRRTFENRNLFITAQRSS
jgi:SAM-dependent methyltransferase